MNLIECPICTETAGVPMRHRTEKKIRDCIVRAEWHIWLDYWNEWSSR